MKRYLALFAALFMVAAPAGAATPLQVRGFCLDVKDGSQANGAALQLWQCATGNTNQQWTFDGGALRAANGKCLDVRDGAFKNGGQVQLWDCVPYSRNQGWTFANGQIKSTASNLCIDVTDGKFGNGGAVQLWACAQGSSNQTWSQGAQSGAPGGANPSGYLQTSGTRIIDAKGREVRLRGTNIGGWLVTEGWMNGYRDDSDKDPYRFSLETLERRFGAQTAADLMKTWQDNFFTSQDLDFIRGVGINAIRVPFGFRNLQRADGSWIKNGAGNIDFSRLDWVVDEAAKRGIYTILDFHIWQGQQANYDLISQNSDGGRDAQVKAAAIWTQVAKRYKGNAWVAAFDAINEPTGSYANLMQDALYKAIRAVDADRIIFMESTGVNPAQMQWKQVSYSIHQYNMMGTDYGANRSAFWADLNGTIGGFSQLGVPTYIGEFMVQKDGDMLFWLLDQYNQHGLHWTSWTYKTVDMGAWGLCNLPGSVRVDILNDNASTIKGRWQNMGQCAAVQPVVDAFKSALR